jgi:glucose/arabinose dehydrogenase
MSQRFRLVKWHVAFSSVLAAAGVIAAGCGSDEPSTSEGQLTGTGGASTASAGAGTGGTGAGVGGSNVTLGGAAGVATAGAGQQPGEVQQPGEIPIDQTQGGSGGATPPEQEPPATGLAPNCAPPEGPVPSVALELVAGGLTQPLYVSGVPGDDTRLMILQKNGLVRVVVDGVLQEAPFLDLTGQADDGFESGGLGLAFHPDYATNGLFYVHYTSDGSDGLPPARDTVVAEFQVDANDRSLANVASRRIVLTIDQPNDNHNGGEITFGPDRMLYLGFGDGGLGDDTGPGHAPIGNGQTLTTLLGKILRIDPLGRGVNDAYGIPPANLAEVTGQQASPEIWAYGMRNPWRFSFDACNGDLYIGDVGQNALEEVDYVAAAAETRTIAAGLNFGWRIMEGNVCGPVAAECTDQTRANLVLPVDVYGRTVGQSVTGGYVYRGSRVPGLRGHYIYADYQTKHIFRFRIQDGQVADRVEITDQIVAPGGGDVENIASFGTDNAGEVYIAAFEPGAVYRIIQAP